MVAAARVVSVGPLKVKWSHCNHFSTHVHKIHSQQYQTCVYRTPVQLQIPWSMTLRFCFPPPHAQHQQQDVQPITSAHPARLGPWKRRGEWIFHGTGSPNMEKKMMDLLPEINPYKLGSWGPRKTSDLVLGGKKNKLEVARLRVFLWKTSGFLWCHRVGAAKPPKWLSSNCSSSSLSNDFIGSQPICHPGFLPKNSTKVLKKLQDFTMTTKSCLVCLTG